MQDPQLHDLAKRLQTVCGVPSFRAFVYTKLFDVICEVIRRDGYQLIPVEKAVRDRLGEIGWPVSRKHVSWILHGLLSTGCDLGDDKTVTPAALADTFEFFVLSLVASNGLELTAEELSLVDQWIEPSHLRAGKHGPGDGIPAQEPAVEPDLLGVRPAGRADQAGGNGGIGGTEGGRDFGGNDNPGGIGDTGGVSRAGGNPELPGRAARPRRVRSRGDGL